MKSYQHKKFKLVNPRALGAWAIALMPLVSFAQGASDPKGGLPSQYLSSTTTEKRAVMAETKSQDANTFVRTEKAYAIGADFKTGTHPTRAERAKFVDLALSDLASKINDARTSGKYPGLQLTIEGRSLHLDKKPKYSLTTTPAGSSTDAYYIHLELENIHPDSSILESENLKALQPILESTTTTSTAVNGSPAIVDVEGRVYSVIRGTEKSEQVSAEEAYNKSALVLIEAIQNLRVEYSKAPEEASLEVKLGINQLGRQNQDTYELKNPSNGGTIVYTNTETKSFFEKR